MDIQLHIETVQKYVDVGFVEYSEQEVPRDKKVIDVS